MKKYFTPTQCINRKVKTAAEMLLTDGKRKFLMEENNIPTSPALSWKRQAASTHNDFCRQERCNFHYSWSFHHLRAWRGFDCPTPLELISIGSFILISSGHEFKFKFLKSTLITNLEWINISHLISGMRSHHGHSVVAFSQEHTQSVQFTLRKERWDCHIVSANSLWPARKHSIKTPELMNEQSLRVHLWLQSRKFRAPDVSLIGSYKVLDDKQYKRMQEKQPLNIFPIQRLARFTSGSYYCLSSWLIYEETNFINRFLGNRHSKWH